MNIPGTFKFPYSKNYKTYEFHFIYNDSILFSMDKQTKAKTDFNHNKIVTNLLEICKLIFSQKIIPGFYLKLNYP